MSSPTLYSFRRCPYAIRARMALQVSKIIINTVEVNLKNKPEAFLKISEKATVPILVVPTDNQVIDESLDIMLWSLGKNDPLGWLNIEDKVTAFRWISENDLEFKLKLDRYKYAVRFPEASELDYRQQAEVFLQKLENQLQQKNYIISANPTIVDVAIFPFIRQFVNVNKNWFAKSPYTQVNRWLTSWLEGDLFRRAMKK